MPHPIPTVRARHRSAGLWQTLPALTLMAFASASLASPTAAPRAAAPAAIHAPVVKLTIEPARLTLTGRRDARRVLVEGQTADGSTIDLTPTAQYQVAGDQVRVDAEGFFQPLKDGRTQVVVQAGGLRAELPIEVRNASGAAPISFVRDVEPVISKVGCNAGTCHGSAKGKNGFKLSLRGYDPDFDHHSLVDDLSGRRFNRSDPNQSLMLLKPTQGVPHGGGMVLQPDSPYYAILRQWIAEGVTSDAGTVKRCDRLEVLPAVIEMPHPGLTQQMLVIAHYPDGASRDVTRDAVYSTSSIDTASISAGGLVKALRNGEAAVLIRYEGVFATSGLTVLSNHPGYHWTPVAEDNYIDRLVDHKLQKVKVVPSELCTDAEFIRRIYLDLTGMPPTPEVIRGFLNDRTPSQVKRNHLIDTLIGSPEFVDFWTHKWGDLLQINRKFMGEKGMWAFYRWVHQAVAANKPYDQFVRELLTAKGSTFQNPPANFYRVNKEPNLATEDVTQLFLGIRFNCNKCHDHPFEKWTQTQYYQLGAYFARVGEKPGATKEEQVIYEKPDGEVKHPKTSQVVVPKFPYPVAGVPTGPATTSRRQQLAAWMTSAQNPFFAKSIANRVWSYFLGRGIIDPVDDIRSGNPPSNPELLDALTRDLLDHQFDLRHLMRTIVQSRVYQESIKTNPYNDDDLINFSHAVPRRLTAEQLSDALAVATGTHAKYPGVPDGFRASQLPDSQVGAGGFLDLFGRPPRESPCECERTSAVSLSQAMNLITGPTVSDALIDPNGRIARLMKTNPDDRTIIEEMYLAVLCRLPSTEEANRALKVLATTPNKAEAAQDLAWALLNSPAFLFNR